MFSKFYRCSTVINQLVKLSNEVSLRKLYSSSVSVGIVGAPFSKGQVSIICIFKIFRLNYFQAFKYVHLNFLSQKIC